jgi:transcriptional regulator with XRE-family HTH domain
MIFPAQSRAARALLNWSQPELAKASGVSVSTIRDFEIGKRTPIGNNLGAIRRALQVAGVEFVEVGVKLRELRVGDRVRYPAGNGPDLFIADHLGEIGTVVQVEGRPTMTIGGGQILVKFGNGEAHLESAERVEFVPE